MVFLSCWPFAHCLSPVFCYLCIPFLLLKLNSQSFDSFSYSAIQPANFPKDTPFPTLRPPPSLISARSNSNILFVSSIAAQRSHLVSIDEDMQPIAFDISPLKWESSSSSSSSESYTTKSLSSTSDLYAMSSSPSLSCSSLHHLWSAIISSFDFRRLLKLFAWNANRGDNVS